jgi:ketosteroid isomerase-like protein
MAVAPEDAIRARRRLTNKLIAAHDAARLRPFFAADARLIPGDGGLIVGAAAIVEAFAGQFRDPDFHTYVREPEAVEVNEAGDRAAETGRWTAHWAAAELSGRYLACWRRQTGQWVIESELFVTLAG